MQAYWICELFYFICRLCKGANNNITVLLDSAVYTSKIYLLGVGGGGGGGHLFALFDQLFVLFIYICEW